MPTGNYPLDDDWSFAKSVSTFLQTGAFKPTAWTGMSLLSNTIWGAIFSILFGYSDFILRLSTIVAVSLSLIIFYYLLKRISNSISLSIVGVFTLLFSPIYFLNTFNFFTDNFSIFMEICSIAIVIKYFSVPTNKILIIITLLSVLAVLSRQSNICIPIAFFLTTFFTSPNVLQDRLKSALPLITSCLSLLALRFYLDRSDATPFFLNFNNNLGSLPTQNLLHLAAAIYQNFFVAIIYLAFFSLPLIPYFFVTNTFKTSYKKMILIIIGLIVFLLLRFFRHLSLVMPYSKNQLHESGLGPMLLSDHYRLNLNNPPVLSFSFWTIVTLISGLASIFLLLHSYTFVKIAITSFGIRNSLQNQSLFFILFLGAGYLFPLLLFGFFEKYLTPLVPVLIMFILYSISDATKAVHVAWKKMLGIFFLILIALFSTFSVRDYFAWNNAKWKALHFLTESLHVPKREIDGGFEFNAVNNYLLNPDPSNEASPWLVAASTYRVGFGALPGYRTVNRFPYRLWFNDSTLYIYAQIHELK